MILDHRGRLKFVAGSTWMGIGKRGLTDNIGTGNLSKFQGTRGTGRMELRGSCKRRLRSSRDSLNLSRSSRTIHIGCMNSSLSSDRSLDWNFYDRMGPTSDNGQRE